MRKNSEYTVDHVIAAEEFVKEKEYWLNKLRGELVKTHFPYDFSPNNKHTGSKKHQVDLCFSREIDSRLLSIANNSELRIFMILAAGLVVLLHKYTGNKDIMIGAPILKQEAHGDFINTQLILRHRLEDNKTFKELLYMVKQTLVEATENQNYPIKSLIRELGLESAVPGEGNPFFDCMILLENIHDKSYIRESNCGMIFSFVVRQGTVHGCIDYDAVRYDERTIEGIARHYEHLFRHILFNSELPLVEMPILPGDEKKQLLVEFNSSDPIPADFNTVVDWFEHQVEKTPGHIAVEYDDRKIDYIGLNRKSNRLARALTRKGVGRDTIAALMFRPSLEMIVGMLAVLKAGGAYLPINPEFPETRIKYILEDSRTGYLLTSGEFPETKPVISKNRFNGEIFVVDIDKDDIYNNESSSNSGTKYEADALAYVIYTSGTTGLPKGVVVEHKGIFNFINWRYHTYGCREKDVTLQLLSYSFDGFMSNLYFSLISGGTLLLVPDEKMLDFNYISRLIKEKGVTNTSIIPKIFDIILQHAGEEDLKSLRLVVLAGEKAEEKLVEKIKEKNPGIILVNEYGPTEASVTVAANKDMEKSPTSVVGKPIANTKIFIFNASFDIVPTGVPGELCAAGPGLARGYLNDPLLTREKFVENPFEKGTLIYRTGDSARWLRDGNIEFKGRMDYQVKLRGFRIELGEIEQQLLNHKNISEAAVTAREDSGGSQYLCAYIVPDSEINAAELKDYLSVYFPDYMIPAYFVSMRYLPLSSNGKVDRKRLPEPEPAAAAEEYAAPRDEVEERLAEIWAGILGCEKDTIGIDANFFEHGGHSLTATILSNRIHKELDVKIPMIEIFESPFIRNMAEYIKTRGKDLFTAIAPADPREYYPTSSAQNRLFVLYQLNPDAVAYNVPVLFQLEGELEMERLEKAFGELIHRHESLRTSFAMIEGNPVQKVHEPADVEFKVKYHNLEGANREAAGQEKIKTFIRPFDLSRSPILRVETVKINPLKHLLMVDMHHIITDGVSLVIMMEEFLALYSGMQLPLMALQYKDFSNWQQSPGVKETMKKQEEFWLRQFENEIPVLNVPTDYPRPKTRSFEGADYFFEISLEETNRLNRLAQSEGATLFMVLLGLFNILLSKVSCQEDIVVGTPVAGRRHAEVERIIGIFINMLALRNHVDGEKSFARFLNDLKPKTLEAFENQDYQFADLVENLDLKRDVSRNPLFDSVFILQNIFDTVRGMGEKEGNGLKINPINHEHRSSQYDLSLQAAERQDNTLMFGVEYCTRLFSEETIARFMGYFKRIISSVIEHPGKKIADIEIITEEEKNQILYEFNDSGSSYPGDKTIRRLFEEQAARTPDGVAVVGKEERNGETVRITYGELNRKSNQLAHLLIERGVLADSIVGIMVEPSIEMVIGILGILKAGGAYLPIDPGYPEGRIDYMLADSGADVLVTVETLTREVPPCSTSQPLDVSTSQPSDLAYVVYTSGTAGTPKGVMVKQRGVVNYASWRISTYGLTPEDVTLQLLSYTFDGFGSNFYSTLLSGGSLVMIPAAKKMDYDYITEVLRQERVTNLSLVPAVYDALLILSAVEGLARLRFVVLGGEKASESLIARSQKKNPAVRHIIEYGPTEASVGAAANVGISPLETAVIGKPIDNTRIYIVNKNLYLQPPGIPGELCISGEGLARGYLNRPELTADMFMFNRSYRSYRSYRLHFSKKLYKTGDLCRWLQDGNIEFLGRLDHQVKIRGFRIELGEIENRLVKHPSVKNAAAICKDNATGDKYICAYIVGDKALETSDLSLYLSRGLPDYMIPAYFVRLEAIPLTPNGKINWRALPEPEMKAEAEYIAPGNEMEEKMVDVWSEVLGIEKNKIGIDANFFQLGGHSLTATMMTAKVHKKLNVRLPLSEVFKTPRIRSLSQYLSGVMEDKYAAVEPAEKKEYYPLSSAQRRVYFIYLMEPQNTVYNLPMVLPLGKDIEKDKIEAVLKKLIARHESLRTSFKEVNRRPVQEIHPCDEVEFQLEYYEMELPGADDTAAGIIENFIRPFDLSRAPLIRSGLVKLPDGGHTWMVDVHHIVSDGASGTILAEDFIDLYAGRELPELRIRYKDFSEWQNRLFAGERIKTQEDYWLNLYPDGEEIPRLQLPTDYKRPKIFTFAGASYHFSLEREDALEFKSLASRNNSTLYMNLLGVLNTLFYKYTGQEDIIIGAGVAGRPHDDLQGIVGMFVNTLAMRNYPRGEQTYESFLKQVSAHCVKAFENQDLQFEELVDMLSLERDISRNPLFDVMMMVQNFQGPRKSRERDSSAESPANIDYRHTTSKLDMTLLVSERGQDVSIGIEYYTGIFKRETIERFARHFKKVIKDVAANPTVQLADIELLSGREKEEVLHRFNDTDASYPRDKTIQRLFEEQVEREAGHVAVEMQSAEPGAHRTAKLSYGQLNEKANRLAGKLREQGVKPNDIVAIMVERSLEMIVGILGILKAGGAYLPIDPLYPLERKAHILRDSGTRLLLSREKWEPVHSEDFTLLNLDDSHCYSGDKENPGNLNGSTDIAYVIYTSGSTGEPKGTMIAHYSLVNRLSWMQKKYPIAENDRILQKTPFTFDVSVWELFWWSITGASLCLLIPGGEKDPGVITAAVETYGVTVMHFVPSMLNAFLEYVKAENSEKRLSGLKQVFSSGEALPLSLVKTFNEMLYRANNTRLANLYGPTEATIDVTFFDCSTGEDLERIPIGKPIDNIKLYVVDKHLKLQPVGVFGELCISGDGLSKGYLNRRELTEEKFTVNPFVEGERLYRTGDLARWLPDGNIEFAGRLDHQVKIRGFRVEPEEIENRLLMHDDIKDAVVVSAGGGSHPGRGGGGSGESYLCAYIVSANELNVSQLRVYLAASLPDYMIPSSFIRVEGIPLTLNGKVDRKALDTRGQKLETGVRYVAPENEIEKIIAGIWKEELNLDKVGLYDNFFDLGGNSLHILQMRSKLKEQLERDIPVTRIFMYPTVDSFSRYLQEEEGDDISSDTVIEESVRMMEETMQLFTGGEDE